MPYPLALALTLTVEVPLLVGAFVLGGVVRWSVRGVAAAVAVTIGVNLATHPLVWLALRDAGADYWPRFVVVEVGAWLAESALLYFLLGRRDARLIALVALLANCASALAGLLLWRTP